MSLPSNELSDTALDALIVREQTRVVAPLTEWHALSERLSAEGILRPSGESLEQSFGARSMTPPATRNQFRRWGTRFVASAALLGIGVVVGRGLTLGQEIAPAIKQAVAESSDSAMTFTSSRTAREVLVRSQNQYQRAAAYLAAHDTSAQIVGGAEMYQERLAALDEIVATTHDQLKAVPDDPVLNQYYQSAVGVRAATMRRLGKVLPAGARIVSY